MELEKGDVVGIRRGSHHNPINPWKRVLEQTYLVESHETGIFERWMAGGEFAILKVQETYGWGAIRVHRNDITGRVK